MLDWIDSDSKMLHSFAWDEDDPTHKLNVRFKNRAGAITAHWKYNKDISVFEGLKIAPSQGKYFNSEIKDSGDGIQVS